MRLAVVLLVMRACERASCAKVADLEILIHRNPFRRATRASLA